MSHLSIVLAATFLAATLALPGHRVAADDGAAVSFLRDVAPMLVQRCQGCHGAKQSESSYRLDTVERLLQPGDYGEPIVTTGSLDESLLWTLLSTDDADTRMPKDGEPIPKEELDAVRRWIESGGEFDVPERDQPLAAQLPRPPYAAPADVYRRPVPITAVALNATADELIVAGYRELTCWNLQDGRLTRRVHDFPERTTALVPSPDGQLLGVAGGTPGLQGEVRLLHADTLKEARLLGTATDMVLGVAFRPDGAELAAAFPDQTIRVYDVASGKERLKMESHADWVTSIAWSHDGKRLVSGSRDKTSKVFEADTGNLVVTYGEHGATVTAALFSLDGTHVISAGEDKKIHSWKVEDGKKEAEITSHGGAVHQLVIADPFLFSTSADRSSQQYQLEDRKLVRRFADQPDWVTAIAVDLPGQRLITGCFGGQVRVSNLMDGTVITELTAAPGYPSSSPAP